MALHVIHLNVLGAAPGWSDVLIGLSRSDQPGAAQHVEEQHMQCLDW